jgi:hypothetical protein
MFVIQDLESGEYLLNDKKTAKTFVQKGSKKYNYYLNNEQYNLE